MVHQNPLFEQMATFDALPATAAQLILKKLSCNNDDLASARLSCKSLRDASCTAITSATPRSNAALLDLCMKWAGLQNLVSFNRNGLNGHWMPMVG